MIRVNVIADAKAAQAYFAQADYYLEGQETVAHWHGKAAKQLGLEGPVRQADFNALCENLDPHTQKQITGRQRYDRRVGYDWTFSAPKSVSLAYALGGDERIADEFRAAVNDAMALAEREMKTRVRKKGAFENRETGNLAWVDFLHHTSRPIDGYPDPQLHVHAVAFNMTFDPAEGEWKAGEFSQLKADAPYFQAAFRANLAHRLQHLGYELRRSRDDFELVGISDDTVKEFSRRTTLIEKTADALGIKRPETKAKLGATTREAKTEGQTWPMLLRAWERRLPVAELALIRHTAAANAPRQPESDNASALDWSLRHLLERRSAVPERQLITQALQHGLGHVTLDGLYAELRSRKDVIRSEFNGVPMVSTQAVLAEEKQLATFAAKGRGQHAPLKGDNRKTLDAKHTALLYGLNPSQKQAVRHVWESPDQLMLIAGSAGTGKTTLTKAALAGVNVPWVILAPSVEASRGVLRREGMEGADTLQKFLLDEEMQAKVRGGLIWIDEASMVGAKDAAKISQLANQLNARVVLSGDARQHRSIPRGDILNLLATRANLPVLEVSEILRQSGAYRDAVKSLSQGKAAAGFDQLDALGWVQEATHEQIAEDYLHALSQGKSAVVIAPAHAEGKAVTAAIRTKLKAGGKLTGDERTFESLVPLHLTEAERAEPSRWEAGTVAQFVRAGGGFRAGTRIDATQLADKKGIAPLWGAYRKETIGLAVGDTIRITGGGKDVTGTHRLNSGATYEVAGFTDHGDITLNNGWTIGKGFGHLAHGQVVTSFASQGKTTDVALVAMGNASLGAINAETLYVSTSRARQKTQIYVEDKEKVREAVQRQDVRVLASDLVKPKPERKPLLHRIKKHLALLRRSLSRTPEPTLQLTPAKEYQYERQ